MSPAAVPLQQGRRIFGSVAETYAEARPDYPDELYQLLATRCGLQSQTAVLEIGPGTGLVTKRLLRMGVNSIRAIEPDARLVEFLTRQLPDQALTIDPCSLEEASLDDKSFDVVVAANSFHWLEQHDALKKVFRVLRPGGWWAMWWMIFSTCGNSDPFQAATQHLFKDVAPFPGTTVDGIPFGLDRARRRDDLRQAGFIETRIAQWRWHVTYDTARLIALYNTFSPLWTLAEEGRFALLRQLADIAERDFHGNVKKTFVTVCYTARRPCLT